MMASETMSVAQRIEQKLQRTLAPQHLAVENESHRHNVPPGSESHFRVTVVAERFAGESLLARHRAVYDTVADELAGPVHALALHTYSPEEWAARDTTPASPPCLGGDPR